ncbi:hypothetical protein CIL05_18550 [Virgibacillus profundi]|uniref:Uncharacterized protein n=1 Tax=Virgibacillus profundi TaxID=2024555 RepID=A0A2A2I9Q5_9BACI|nr:hypothetical protein CIL05_18550 [Virgibacillus profundi]
MFPQRIRALNQRSQMNFHCGVFYINYGAETSVGNAVRSMRKHPKNENPAGIETGFSFLF